MFRPADLNSPSCPGNKGVGRSRFQLRRDNVSHFRPRRHPARVARFGPKILPCHDFPPATKFVFESSMHNKRVEIVVRNRDGASIRGFIRVNSLHATTPPCCPRRISAACAQPRGRQDQVFHPRQGFSRLREPSYRSARAVSNPHPRLVPDEQSLALRRPSGKRRTGDRVFPLADPHARHAMAHVAQHRRSGPVIPGSIQEFSDSAGRTSADGLPICGT